jgi:serine/threonine-protein kinase
VDDELRATLKYTSREQESLAQAITRHLNSRELYDAALATRAAGDPHQAAELFEQSQHHAEAAACWFEAREPKRCLDNASKVSRGHALYPSCARLAVQAAALLNQVPAQLEGIVAHWRSCGPRDTYDGELFLQLGDLFAGAGQRAVARSVYEQVLSIDRGAAGERLAKLDRDPQGRSMPEAIAATGEPATPSGKPAAPSVAHDPFEDDPPGLGSMIAGRYHLEDYLGQGGSATVYRAWDLALGQTIALKVFSGPFDHERQARFKREINLARKFSHDNIVRIFDLVLADKLQGITMELIEGVTLSDFVRKHACSLGARRQLLIQAAAALGYAHSHGVIHRDVKPDNLLVTAGALLKVTDFGIAKAHEETSITMSGVFAGTPYYVAPEQVSSFKNVDHRADIYSLGVVAYELFAGVAPFEGKNMLEILAKHAYEAPRSPRAIEQRLPLELSELLLHALEKVPAKRVQSCEEFSARLAAIDLPD